MDKQDNYIDNLIEVLHKVKDSQSTVIEEATRKMFEAYQKGNSIYVFGAGHAGLIAEEMFARAGGLMVINPIFNSGLLLHDRPFTVASELERLEGYGTAIINGTWMKEGDVLLVYSVSGRNAAVIDVAIAAKARGAYVIVMTSKVYKDNIKSRHSGGKLLPEYGDLVIDNCGIYGDASVQVDENTFVGPTSTATGVAIANMIAVGFAQLCVENGIEPPVFESGNKDGNPERIKRIMMDNLKYVHYL